MAKPPAGPPPNIMADVSPQDGSTPAAVPDGNPDGPIPLPVNQDLLSKLGLTTPVQPGQSILATVKITSGGTAEDPTFDLTAIGEVRPDDGTADLVSIGNDAADPAPGIGGAPAAMPTPPVPGIDDGSNGGTDIMSTKRGAADDDASNAPDAEEAMLGYKRPKKGLPPKISAKDALG